jgi:hypothetical protein
MVFSGVRQNADVMNFGTKLSKKEVRNLNLASPGLRLVSLTSLSMDTIKGLDFFRNIILLL